VADRISWRLIYLLFRLCLVAAVILVLRPTSLGAQQLSQEWTERIPGGFAQAITADNHDNSYVTGYVCTASTCASQSPITVLQVVKYDKSGNASELIHSEISHQIWTRSAGAR
jgi:hypothetical protein